jgi:hypothetical protein
VTAVSRLFAVVDRTLHTALVAVAPADRHHAIRNAAMKRPIIANVRLGAGIHLLAGNDHALLSNVRVEQHDEPVAHAGIRWTLPGWYARGATLPTKASDTHGSDGQR